MTKNSNNIKPISPNEIESIVNKLKGGRVFVYPTETCYGLGCLVDAPESIARIFDIKERVPTKAFPVLFPDLETLKIYTEFDDGLSKKLAKHFWPGPLNLILPAREKGRAIFPSRPASLAVRISPYPLIQELLKGLSVPLISTSANISGQKTAETIEQAINQLGASVDYYIDGGTLPVGASTILDLTSIPPKILREGAISSEKLKELI